ncbi:Circumsporozoite protein [Diplonema papillatum]|nr:Circumsporozoite protein [Diplonema papillatum]
MDRPASRGSDFKTCCYSSGLTRCPLLVAGSILCVLLAASGATLASFGDRLELDVEFEGFKQTDHFSSRREAGLKGSDSDLNGNRPLHRVASSLSTQREGEPFASATPLFSLPDWNILFIYSADDDDNLLVPTKLAAIAAFEKAVWNTRAYQEAGWRDVSAEFSRASGSVGAGGLPDPAPLGSLMQYLFPSVYEAHEAREKARALGCCGVEPLCVWDCPRCEQCASCTRCGLVPVVNGKGRAVSFDGRGDVMQPVGTSLLSALTGSNSASVQWFTGSDLDVESMSVATLRTEVAFGAPTRTGYGDDGVEDFLFDFVDAAWDHEGILSAAGVSLSYGGQIVTDAEVMACLIRDAQLAFASVVIVFAYLFLHLSSLFLATAGIVQLLITFPASVFIYSFVFGESYLGAMNVLSFYIMIGIGVDDLFVFSNSFLHCEKPAEAESAARASKKAAEEDPPSVRAASWGEDTAAASGDEKTGAADQPDNVSVRSASSKTTAPPSSGTTPNVDERVAYALRRSGAAMLVTSATSAVAFLANLLSPIPAVSSFGLLMGILVAMNYVLTITLYPAVMVLWMKHVARREAWVASKVACCCKSSANASVQQRDKVGMYTSTHSSGGSVSYVEGIPVSEADGVEMQSNPDKALSEDCLAQSVDGSELSRTVSSCPYDLPGSPQKDVPAVELFDRRSAGITTPVKFAASSSVSFECKASAAGPKTGQTAAAPSIFSIRGAFTTVYFPLVSRGKYCILASMLVLCVLFAVASSSLENSNEAPSIFPSDHHLHNYRRKESLFSQNGACMQRHSACGAYWLEKREPLRCTDPLIAEAFPNCMVTEAPGTETPEVVPIGDCPVGFVLRTCGCSRSTVPEDMSCLGCDGVAGSGMILDRCGVCGGNGTSCPECDDGRIRGACGCQEPGVPDLSCLGCDNVAFSGKVVDHCGVCGGTGNCSCGQGMIHGPCGCHEPRLVDESCVGCDGGINSGVEYDACGVCGGNNSCFTISPTSPSSWATGSPSGPSTPSQSGPSTPPGPTSPSGPSTPSGPTSPPGPSTPSGPTSPPGPSTPGTSSPSGPSTPGTSSPSGPSTPGTSSPSAPSTPSKTSTPTAPPTNEPSPPSVGPSAPPTFLPSASPATPTPCKYDQCGVCGGNNDCVATVLNVNTVVVTLLWGVDADRSRETGDGQFVAAYDPNFHPGDPECQMAMLRACSLVAERGSGRVQENNAHWRCMMVDFDDWLKDEKNGKRWSATPGTYGLPAKEETFELALSDYLTSGRYWNYHNGKAGWNGGLKTMREWWWSTVDSGASAFDVIDEFDFWEGIADEINSIAPPTCQAYQTAEEWPNAFTQIAAIHGFVYAVVTSLAVSFLVVLMFTCHPWVTFLVIFTMCSIMAATFATFWMLGWSIGAVEAVALSVVIGLSADYCLHVAEAYLDLVQVVGDESFTFSRSAVVERVVADIGPPLINAAATTVLSTVPLLFCTVIPLRQFGFVLLLSIVFSIVYTLFLFVPLLLVVGPKPFKKTILRRVLVVAVPVVCVGIAVLAIFASGTTVRGPGGEPLLG